MQLKVKSIRGQLSNVYVENKGKVFNTDLTSYLELEFMVDVAESICQGANARFESRGHILELMLLPEMIRTG